MIQKSTILECDCCGVSFHTEYYHGGSIEHNNYTNDGNMYVMVSNFKDADPIARYRFFLDSITLGGNFCNIKDHTFKVGMQIFECRLKWLVGNDHKEMAEYLEKNRINIKEEFNKVTERLISEKITEVDNLRKRLINLKTDEL